MADWMDRPCPRPRRRGSLRHPSPLGLARLAPVLVLVAACGRYDREIESSDPGFDSDLGESASATATTTTTTTDASDASASASGETGGPTCADACPELGATACVGDGVITCTDGGDGCPGWSAPAACDAGEHCDAGACVLPASTRFDPPIAWAVPEGGLAGYGYNGVSGGALDLGDAYWTVLDLDGDRRQDLVVTSRALENQNYKWVQRTMGYPNAPYWEVYRGGDAGFAAQPIAWQVPSDGHQGHGLIAPTGTPELKGDPWWTLVDVDGDGRVELVVAGRSVVFDGWLGRPLGYPDAPYWEVYASTDDGFAALPSIWRLPDGGPPGYGYFTFEYLPWLTGDPAWTTRDLDGDGYLDLVVTGIGTEYVDAIPLIAALGSAQEPRWDVYRGGPEGFAAAPIPWAVPVGGWGVGGFAVAEGEPLAVDDDRWRLADLDGDGRDDLVVVASADGVGADETLELATAGFPEAPHWWFHHNLGDGFSRAASAWSVPAGGLQAGGFVDLAGDPVAAGDHAWALRDVDGDQRKELVVMGLREALKGVECEARALGVADGAPRWDVYEPLTLGYSAAPRAFAVPDVGVGECGLSASAGAPLAIGDPSWSTVDLDGDRRLDLVVTGAGAGDPLVTVVFGAGLSPRWDLYRGAP